MSCLNSLNRWLCQSFDSSIGVSKTDYYKASNQINDCIDILLIHQGKPKITSHYQSRRVPISKHRSKRIMRSQNIHKSAASKRHTPFIVYLCYNVVMTETLRFARDRYPAPPSLPQPPALVERARLRFALEACPMIRN